MNSLLLKFKIKILEIKWINILLQHTYFLHKYIKNVKKLILPNLKSIGILENKNDSNVKINSKIFVPYIETSYGKIFLFILILKALQIRGAKIYILICNKALQSCEKFSVKNPYGGCKSCSFINKNLIPKLGFNVIEINDFLDEDEIKEINVISMDILKSNPNKYIFHGVDIIPVINDSLLRYYYGGKKIKPNIKIKKIKTALISTKVAHNVNKKINPNIVVAHMNAYSEFQPYNLYFEKSQNVSVFIIKGSAWKPDSININIMDLYRNENRYNEYLSTRKEKKLSFVEKRDFYNFLNERFSGNNYEFTSNSFYDESYEDKNISILKIDQSKKNIFLFTNVEWDAGLGECNTIFKDVMSWVFFTIDSIKNNENIHLYIKTHPSETYGVKSVESVAQKINKKYNGSLKNVTLITPEYKIKPYSLFKYIDVGIVLFGTLGLEMTLKGLPVISLALSPYSRKGFVHEPKNRKEYLKMLLSRNNNIEVDKEKLELFAYYYFIKTLIPFNLAKKYYGFNLESMDYNINSINDLGQGSDKYLDHVCDCILNNKIIEDW